MTDGDRAVQNQFSKAIRPNGTAAAAADRHRAIGKRPLDHPLCALKIITLSGSDFFNSILQINS
jgi:hypothetical protein